MPHRTSSPYTAHEVFSFSPKKSSVDDSLSQTYRLEPDFFRSNTGKQWVPFSSIRADATAKAFENTSLHCQKLRRRKPSDYSFFQLLPSLALAIKVPSDLVTAILPGLSSSPFSSRIWRGIIYCPTICRTIQLSILIPSMPVRIGMTILEGICIIRNMASSFRCSKNTMILCTILPSNKTALSECTHVLAHGGRLNKTNRIP